MSEEQLEKIKSIYTDDRIIAEYAGINLTLKDYDYLIEQAERAEGLEAHNTFLERANRINVNIAEDMKEERNQLIEKNNYHVNKAHENLLKLKLEEVKFMGLEQQNKRYREALEFYADIENYEEYEHRKLGLIIDVVEDRGEKARKALNND